MFHKKAKWPSALDILLAFFGDRVDSALTVGQLEYAVCGQLCLVTICGTLRRRTHSR